VLQGRREKAFFILSKYWAHHQGDHEHADEVLVAKLTQTKTPHSVRRLYIQAYLNAFHLQRCPAVITTQQSFRFVDLPYLINRAFHVARLTLRFE